MPCFRRLQARISFQLLEFSVNAKKLYFTRNGEVMMEVDPKKLVIFDAKEHWKIMSWYCNGWLKVSPYMKILNFPKSRW
jgi:hypothetical protein